MIVDWLIREKIVHESDRELYSFAIDNLFFQGVPFCIGIISGLVCACFFETILFEIIFLELRSAAGGYHMKSKRLCLISSSLILGCCGWLISIGFDSWILFYQIVASGFITLTSPVKNENKELTESEIVQQRNKSIAIVVLSFIMTMGLIQFSFEKFANAISLAVVLTGITHVPVLCRKIRA